VIDMLKAKKLKVTGVTITGGDMPHDRTDGTLTCPKRDICSALVVAAQSGAVKVAKGLECAEEFEKEVGAFGYNIRRQSGKMGYESIVDEVHDDLVVAAALGLWYSTQKLPKGFPGAAGRGATVEDNDYNPLAQ
jgi:hypothetical protein